MTSEEAMRRIDAQLSHVWVVRTFLKHSEEAEEADDLQDVVRVLYDYCLALGPAWTAQDATEYLKLAHKKYSKLRDATAEFVRIQPEVSAHTNFKMAVTSLNTAMDAIGELLRSAGP